MKSFWILFLFSSLSLAKTTSSTTTTVPPKDSGKPLIDSIDDELIKARKGVKGALGDLEDSANKAAGKLQEAVGSRKKSKESAEEPDRKKEK